MTNYHVRAPPTATAHGPNNHVSVSEKFFVVGFVSMALAFIVLIACCGGLYFVRRRRARASVAATPATSPCSIGLEQEVISSLRVFLYESEGSEEKTECAVCLSEFRDGEEGRMLPGCGHRFHVECIDTWFRSHRTCPLCRLDVKVADAGLAV